jgi:hypothetical protein
MDAVCRRSVLQAIVRRFNSVSKRVAEGHEMHVWVRGQRLLGGPGPPQPTNPMRMMSLPAAYAPAFKASEPRSEPPATAVPAFKKSRRVVASVCVRDPEFILA